MRFETTDTPSTMDATGLEPAFSVQQLVSHYGNSESFWRKELSRKRLRFFKLGSATRISKTALMEYLQKKECQ